jgi:hypothetical protein
MKPEIIVHANQEAWLAERTAARGSPLYAIGASDVPAILGRSSFKGPWDLWREHHDVVKSDPADDDDVRTRGHVVEPYLMRSYSEITGRRVDARLLTIVDPENPWRRVSTDALIVGDRAIEGKTFSYQAGNEWAKHHWLDPVPVREAVIAGLVPDGYAYQTIFTAAVCKVNVVDIIGVQCSFNRRAMVLSTGETTSLGWVLEREPVIVSLYIQQGIIDWLLHTVTEWRERHLVNGEMPDPDGSAAHIQAYAGRQMPGCIPATPEMRAAAADLAQARAVTKGSKAREDAAKGTILDLLGEYHTAYDPGDRDAYVARARKTKRGMSIDAKDTLT